jgi:hypothetical protein
VPDVVKLSNPAEIVQAIPQLLGYQPTDSIVMVCLRGGRRRFGLTLRCDLELAASAPVELVDDLALRSRHEGARGVIVVVYGDRLPMAGEDLPYRDLADLMEAKSRFPLAEMVYTARDRCWSYLCDAAGCCPPEGVRLDPRSPALARLAAERVAEGQAVLPDRAALTRSVAADGECLEERRAAVAGQIGDAEDLPIDVRCRRVRELSRTLVDRLADPRGVISDAEAFELAGLMWQVIGRDEVLALGADPDRLVVLLRVFRQVVRRVPPPFDAPVCTMLAWFAYADGDGTLANIALERALETDPGYSLAQLIRDGLTRQVPPSCLHEVMRGAAEDLRGRSAAG